MIVLGTFGAGFYWSDGYVTNQTMTRGVIDAAGWCGLVQFGIFGSILVRGAVVNHKGARPAYP